MDLNAASLFRSALVGVVFVGSVLVCEVVVAGPASGWGLFYGMSGQQGDLEFDNGDSPASIGPAIGTIIGIDYFWKIRGQEGGNKPAKLALGFKLAAGLSSSGQLSENLSQGVHLIQLRYFGLFGNHDLFSGVQFGNYALIFPYDGEFGREVMSGRGPGWGLEIGWEHSGGSTKGAMVSFQYNSFAITKTEKNEFELIGSDISATSDKIESVAFLIGFRWR